MPCLPDSRFAQRSGVGPSLDASPEAPNGIDEHVNFAVVLENEHVAIRAEHGDRLVPRFVFEPLAIGSVLDQRESGGGVLSIIPVFICQGLIDQQNMNLFMSPLDRAIRDESIRQDLGKLEGRIQELERGLRDLGTRLNPR